MVAVVAATIAEVARNRASGAERRRAEPVLVADPGTLREALIGADALIVDLTSDAAERIEQIRIRRPPGVRTLAFYSHVETDVRARAEQAGFDLVVPRSRMAREGGTLVDRLTSGT